MRKFFVHYKVTIHHRLMDLGMNRTPDTKQYHTGTVSIEGKVNEYTIRTKLEEQWENYPLPITIDPISWSLVED